MDWKLQKDIATAFFRSSILGYGGGPSAIPLVHKEVVERYNWMDDDEFADVLALGNTLPGPINTKMAGYIGYRIGGLFGMINGIIVTALPTVVIMIALIGVLSAYRDSRIVNGMTEAIGPLVAVMLFTLTYSFLKQSKKNVGWMLTIVLSVLSFIALQFLHIHPGIVIAALLLIALLSPVKQSNKEEKTT
ncbi:chromate transporter [Gracilibacillus sp. S3-1-1]|uniref:Chromate transporter n=1 Tax=Gracilibacillus pellucidus TaxID=3095368 RepID=A0ACC6M3M5_9BACI|nr:chromate transporter [Gracilibacillus sp. S3-1-1]MDX8045561.1 chromate transporter [Gracilibacillus sp. S3-1-1]